MSVMIFGFSLPLNSGWHQSCCPGEGFFLTFNLGIGPLLSVPDVHEIKRSLGLSETQGKVFEVGLVVDCAVSPHCLAQACQVGTHLGDNLDLACVLVAHVRNGRAEGVGGLFASLDALLDVGLSKLVATVRCWRVVGLDVIWQRQKTTAR